MLYARANREYVNHDELAKKIALDIVIRQSSLPEDQKEVSLKPQKISGQLQYGYDTLFQLRVSSPRTLMIKLPMRNLMKSFANSLNYQVI